MLQITNQYQCRSDKNLNADETDTNNADYRGFYVFIRISYQRFKIRVIPPARDVPSARLFSVAELNDVEINLLIYGYSS
jgi:hypothetical protein